MVEALEAAKSKVGGASGLAKLLGGITPQAVGQWRRVPAERTLEVERITGVSRHELRPDLYPVGSENEAAE
jgi:DNA-binding transcriptional regulator YdaS (Cro superfamily)